MTGSIDLDVMREIVEELYVPHVKRHFGDDGVNALRHMVSTVRRIYRDLDPSLRSGELVVVARPYGRHSAISFGQSIHTIAPGQMVQHQLLNACLVDARESGYLEVFAPGPDLSALSMDAVVYHYHDRVERVFVGGEAFKIRNPSPAAMASIFAKPTFSNLDAALTRYATEVVRKTVCFILDHKSDGIWADGNRLFLSNKPEAVMRQSLHQFLRDAFPDAEVRPEQIVDESHPVDIKITWADTTHRAIIEIKWLGDSVKDNGEISTLYRDARANSGAKQLSEYLDEDSEASGRLRTRGYLVVFDARRRGLKEGQTTVNASNGLYYRDRDIDYDPDYHITRDDFAKPVRMFAEPRTA